MYAVVAAAAAAAVIIVIVLLLGGSSLVWRSGVRYGMRLLYSNGVGVCSCVRVFVCLENKTKEKKQNEMKWKKGTN